jgi:hypothetical protein
LGGSKLTEKLLTFFIPQQQQQPKISNKVAVGRYAVFQKDIVGKFMVPGIAWGE